MMEWFDNYTFEVAQGIEFLIAVGSIIGFLGMIIGFILFIWGTKRMRGTMIIVIIVSFVLLGVCGFSTGLKYFRIFH
jgi:ABC-type xylose transport system permease subunit